MERLIAAVRRHPCLWDTAAREYRDQDLKDAAWTDVLSHTDMNDVKEVKLRWKKLRDSYRDALKRQNGESGAGGRWKYSEQMSFLAPHIGRKRSTTEDTGSEEAEPMQPPASPPLDFYNPVVSADPLESFFSSMCAATQRLPAPVQLAVKRAVFEVVLQAEERQLSSHNHMDFTNGFDGAT